MRHLPYFSFESYEDCPKDIQDQVPKTHPKDDGNGKREIWYNNVHMKVITDTWKRSMFSHIEEVIREGKKYFKAIPKPKGWASKDYDPRRTKETPS